MPISFGQIATKRLPATIEFENGEKLQVEFYPQRITPKMLASFVALDSAPQDAAQAIERLNLSVDVLEKLLASWDLVESFADDGTPGPAVPIDRAHLEELGVALLVDIVKGIFQSNNMGK